MPAKSRARENNTVSLLSCQKDSGAGFFLEDEDLTEDATPVVVKQAPPPIPGEGKSNCEECGKEFTGSTLLRYFDVDVCDRCKELEQHGLCTKTDAKQTYLLKDCDIDARQPALKYMLKKNPHNEHWGQMMLFYRPHVVARATQVWGSLENIEEERDKRVDNKEKTKQKRYEKRIKELRRAVRTSTWKKTQQKHEHEYDSQNEVYNEEDDEYIKKCTICGHELTYEKM